MEDDPEYFQNWVQKLDILCAPQSEVGLIGSAFFVGAIACISFVPKLADEKGRIPVLIMTYTTQFVALLFLILTRNLKFTIFFVFVLGFSHPGKNIVSFNYVLEQIPAAMRQDVVTTLLVVENGWIIVIAFFYQYIDRSWQTL